MDYEAILRAAEAEADVVLWDGGNNDTPFYRPDLSVVVADPLRPGHELTYHPGETNLRMADVVILNKIDSAEPAAIEQVLGSIAAVNPTAQVVQCRSALTLSADITGLRVAVVEDGPTLTHGGMAYGAGVVAARRFGALRIVDPRPYAVGTIAEVIAAYPMHEPLIPAMGYGDGQVRELEATLNAMPADVVLAATPIDLTRVLTLNKPIVRVRYELEEVVGPSLESVVEPIVRLARAGLDRDSGLSREASMTAIAGAPGSAPAGPGTRHFLTLASVDPAGLRSLLDLAHRAKRDPAAFRGALAGGKVGMIFDKPSTRTRVSLEAAAWALGMLPVVLRPDELQLGRGETVADTAAVLSRYLDAVTVRTFAQARVEELAAGSTIPIVNALTDEHHPCQALADLMTLEEAFGSLDGITLAYVGDGDNVCHSLIEGAALGGFGLRIGCPGGLRPGSARSSPPLAPRARRPGGASR